MTEEFYRSVGGVKIVEGDTGEIVWNFGVFAIGSGRGTPTFADRAPHLIGTGAGKTVLLYEAARQVMGQDLDPGPQKIGDCVSWGWSGSVDLVACVQIATGGMPQQFNWDLRTCTEATYALSRVEYGNLDGSYSDGSVGSWAAEAVSKGGTLSRKRLGPYDPQRAKQWGAKGLPDDLEPEARQQLVKTVALVTTYEQARDAIANGYPVAVCSGVGYEGKRDQDGFIRRRGSWAHCMKYVACRDDGKPGLLQAQSWGLDHAGEPKGQYDIPDNCWWVTPEDANAQLREQDSFALSQFMGYPAQTIPWIF